MSRGGALVRRLVLIALAAALAVALPVAADEGSEPPSGSCEPLDLFCDEAGGSDPTETTSCKPYEVNPPTNGPVTETVLIDPEGCYRDAIRRALGWPPTDQDPVIQLYVSAIRIVFGP